jgi:hypothetical protein
LIGVRRLSSENTVGSGYSIVSAFSIIPRKETCPE